MATDTLTKEEKDFYIKKAIAGEDIAQQNGDKDNGEFWFERKPNPVRVELTGTHAFVTTVPWIGY